MVGLTRVGDSVRLGFEDVQNRIGRTDYLEYPRPYLVGAVNTYAHPSTRSAVIFYPRTATESGDYHVGGTLTALCNIDVTPELEPKLAATSYGWWTRIPQGWVQSHALSVDAAEPTTDGPVPGLPTCDRSNLTAR